MDMQDQLVQDCLDLFKDERIVLQLRGASTGRFEQLRVDGVAQNRPEIEEAE